MAVPAPLLALDVQRGEMPGYPGARPLATAIADVSSYRLPNRRHPQIAKPRSPGRPHRSWIKPTVVAGDHAIGFARPPAADRVLIHRRYVAQHRIDDPPLH